MKNKNENEVPEILIPKGYDLDEFLDLSDGEDEEPIFTEEVKIRFE